TFKTTPQGVSKCGSQTAPDPGARNPQPDLADTDCGSTIPSMHEVCGLMILLLLCLWPAAGGGARGDALYVEGLHQFGEGARGSRPVGECSVRAPAGPCHPLGRTVAGTYRIAPWDGSHGSAAPLAQAAVDGRQPGSDRPPRGAWGLSIVRRRMAFPAGSLSATFREPTVPAAVTNYGGNSCGEAYSKLSAQRLRRTSAGVHDRAGGVPRWSRQRS
ncbi:MAG: hypothetical protein JWO98_3327, partial [Frankiales bacterium]|nr:hypothetical protein [Frankiales bacterium]